MGGGARESPARKGRELGMVAVLVPDPQLECGLLRLPSHPHMHHRAHSRHTTPSPQHPTGQHMPAHSHTDTRARVHTHTHTHTHTMQTWEHRKVRAGKIIAGKGIECLRPSRARYGSVLAMSGREKSRRACTGEQEGRNRRRRGLAERDQCTDGSKRQAAAKDHARARTFRPGPARRLHARALFVSTREGR